MIDFTCNLCGSKNSAAGALERERPSCATCGSNVRTRGLLRALSMELFGMALAAPDFPRVKSLRALGTSDSSQYAERLAEKFDYRNTFYDRAPRFDIANADDGEAGQYDFLISSEVFEHVPPPAEEAFRNCVRLLKPAGFLVLTVPYSLEGASAEHFVELHEFGVVSVGGQAMLVNRTREGRVEVFENLVFHSDGQGTALELREFSERALRGMLVGAGFRDVRIYAEDYAPFGIVHSESWSLPMVAHKGTFRFDVDATREVLEQWKGVRQKLDEEMRKLGKSYWFRLGRKLGWL